MKRILTKREVAVHFCVSEDTIDEWRRLGILKPPINYRGGPKVLFHIEDIMATENFLRGRRIGALEVGMPVKQDKRGTQSRVLEV